MYKKLVIYGNGSFSEYVAYAFEKDSDYEITAFCVENEFHNEKTFSGKPLVSFEDLENFYPPDKNLLFIAIGNNIIRKRIYEESKAKGYSFATYISAKAQFWDELICGENCFIDYGCKVHPFVEVGNNTLIMFSTIGHHVKIGNHNLLSVTTLGGNTKVGNDCFLGMNSVIQQNVNIGNKNIIGMGCTIKKDTQSNSVFTNNGTIKRDLSYEKVANRFLK